MQNIQTSLLPFHLHRKTVEIAEGLTLDQIVKTIYPKKIPGIDIIVNINDEIIPMSRWCSIKPKPHTLVGVNAVAGKGGGGGKNPLAIILTIAIVIAAPYIAAAIAPVSAAAVAAGTAGIFSAESLTIGAIRIGIGLVGFLATSMLSSVPKQAARASAQASPAEPSSQFIEGASNKVDRYGVIPVNLGVNRMFPPQAAVPYTETSGNKQYVRQMFTYGFGKLQITDRRIGETAMSEYDGIEINDRLNGDLNDGVSLYTNDVFQDGYSVLLSSATGYVTRTTQKNTDEADIDITFNSGLTEYNDSGQRQNRTVQFELQYAPTGTASWSTGSSGSSIAAQSVDVPAPIAWYPSDGKRIGYVVLVLNINTGVVSAVSYDQGSQPIIPANSIRIASLRTESTSASYIADGNVYNLLDERGGHASVFSGFDLTYGGLGLNISVASGTINASGGQTWEVSDATGQALRISRNVKFPARAAYDIRIRRITDDTENDRIRDAALLTAIRSIRYAAPVLQPDISGTAIRMVATDQLNGTVSSYNVIASTLIKDYDATLDMWVDNVISSNPASIFRYVLQSSAFVKRLSDARIDIEKLEEWHVYCRANNLTYNRIIDQPTSIDDLLSDIAAAGMATTHKINGVYGVLIDNERPSIKGMITPRNSWGYSGAINYPDLPHALRVQFRNPGAGYNTDERIVYSDGYDETNATLFERLEFQSCTNSDLAWYYGRRYMATALLQPEIHTCNMDFENLTFNRGDKVVFVNDVILVGVGQGRILDLVYDDPDSPTEVTGFSIDDEVDIPTTNSFGVRIRYGNAAGFFYHSLNTAIGITHEFTFTTPIPIADAPPLDSLCAFTEFGKELELVITEIGMNKDHSARITAVNYAPERFDATTGDIPPFSSNITLSSDFYRPLPPEIGGEIQSDESVMIKNSDGSFISRMIIPLINHNEPSMNVIVKFRPVGATQWSPATILNRNAELLVLAGFEDGSAYDIQIFYQRPTGLQLVSIPLILSNTVYIGASSAPRDVNGFKMTSSNENGLFEWDNNTDIDIHHYKMKFTRLTSGAMWVNAQIVADNIKGNRITLPIQSGTFLIKAVDILGNESENATAVISLDNGAFNNVVELLDQQPTWPGIKVNTQVIGSDLFLIDPDLPGYYYFDPDPFILGDVYESTLSSTIIAVGAFYSSVRDIASIRGESSLRDAGTNFVRLLTSIRNSISVRGIDPADWLVRLEISKSADNITYTAWEPFIVGKHIFNYLRLRLYMESTDPTISPKVSTAEVLIDMPDRSESGTDVACPPSGAIVTYNVAFRNDPAVNITLQNAAVDDRLEYVYKNENGFHVKVYNATTAAYETRSLDYNSTGFGRAV